MRIKITATISAKTSTKLRKRTLKNLKEMLNKLDFEITLANHNCTSHGKLHKKNFDGTIEFLDTPLIARKPGPHDCQIIKVLNKPDPLIKISKTHKNHTLNHKPTL